MSEILYIHIFIDNTYSIVNMYECLMLDQHKTSTKFPMFKCCSNTGIDYHHKYNNY
jgi:hypothetical protein